MLRLWMWATTLKARLLKTWMLTKALQQQNANQYQSYTCELLLFHNT